MDFNTLLGQMEANRPDLASSFALIRQYQQSKDDDSSGPVRQEADRTTELEQLLEKQIKLNKRLFDHYRRLESNYEGLVKHLDDLADATGACPHCWGEDSSCSYCRGKGKPGFFEPDTQQYDIYIRPLLGKTKSVS